MSDFAIQVDNVYKSYKITRKRADIDSGLRTNFFGKNTEIVNALSDVSFTLNKGDALGVVGSNGSGKSTLLKLIARVTPPTSGNLKIFGTVGALDEVGSGFHPELTGRENVYLLGSLLGMERKQIRARFKEIVAFAGVGKYLDTPIKRYSSGMHVRLGFSVAAHMSPDILIIDEVLAVGDAEFQQKCLSKIQAFRQQGITIIFVSHNMGLVRLLCDTAIYIDKGHLLSSGDVSTVVGDYLAKFQVNSNDPNLSAITERTGAGNTKFTYASVGTTSTDTNTVLVSGSSAVFRFTVSNPTIALECSFGIYDHTGIPITTIYSSNVSRTGLDLIQAAKPHQFECAIEQLTLLPGKYRVDVCLTANGVVEDAIDGAFIFEVISGSIDGRSIVEAYGYGSVHVSHKWKIS